MSASGTNSVQGINELSRALGRMIVLAGNTKPAMLEIAQEQVSSFQESFRVGGRPAWIPSKRVARKGAGRTLVLSGALMHSIVNPQVTATSIEHGSNLPYAAVHQFGTGDKPIKRDPQTLLFRQKADGRMVFSSHKREASKKRAALVFQKSKAYEIMIPARPYFVFQPEDLQAAAKIIEAFILDKKQ